MRARFPETKVQYLVADFGKRLDLPPLDGVVMANSLHFQRQKDPVLQLVRGYLKPAWAADSGGIQCGPRQYVGALSAFVWHVGGAGPPEWLRQHDAADNAAQPLA